MNHYREALKEPGNLIGVATAVVLSAAMWNMLPLLVGVALEILYLVVVPNSPWYRIRLYTRKKAVEERRRQAFKAQVLPALRTDMQQRYVRLEAMRGQIATQMEPEQEWFNDVTLKLDYLLDKFLVFAGKEAMFLQYLRGLRDEVSGRDRNIPPARRRSRVDQDAPAKSAGLRQDATPKPNQHQLDPTQRWGQQMVYLVRAAYISEMEDLNRELASVQDPGTQAVVNKRAEILSRRSEFLEKIGKLLLNLGHQLQLLEDAFGLINDQLCARVPEQVVVDIDDVVSQTDSMIRVLEELAPYEQMVSNIDRFPPVSQ